jgi:hypothetical protein
MHRSIIYSYNLVHSYYMFRRWVSPSSIIRINDRTVYLLVLRELPTLLSICIHASKTHLHHLYNLKNRVLVQNHEVHLAKKFTSFYATVFITALTTARHLSLTSTKLIPSMPSILFLYSLPVYAQVFLTASFLLVYPPNACTHFCFPPYMPLSSSFICSPEHYLIRYNDDMTGPKIQYKLHKEKMIKS